MAPDQFRGAESEFFTCLCAFLTIASFLSVNPLAAREILLADCPLATDFAIAPVPRPAKTRLVAPTVVLRFARRYL